MESPNSFSPSDASRHTSDVLYLASIDFPHIKARAVQIVNTCHALARAGWRVTLVVGRREQGSSLEHLGRYGLAPHPNLRILGVPAVRIPASAPAALQKLYTRFWSWTYLVGCLGLLPRLLQARPRLLFARDYRLAWLLIKLSRLHRRQVVFEVHGLPSAELVDAQERTCLEHRGVGAALSAPGPDLIREASRRRRLEQVVFNGSWRLLPITDCLKARLIDDYALQSSKVFTVRDASRTPSANRRLAAEETQTSRTRQPEGPHLIYVGQLYAWKGLELALRALAQVPGAKLTIVGGLADDPELPRLERLGRELGISERVSFSGPQPYASVPSLLASADVALLPLGNSLVARCFTSPLKLFDYLAAGLPIVAVDLPTTREVLRDGHNGLLVPPDDPTAMAQAINRLLGDPNMAARLSRQALSDASHYTWDSRAEQIISALSRNTR